MNRRIPMVLVIKGLELHVDVLDRGDLFEEAHTAVDASNIAMGKLEGNPALINPNDPIQFESRPSEDNEFECTLCQKIEDIDDSIRLGDELWCANCVEETQRLLKERAGDS